jgi:hypothetical protein
VLALSVNQSGAQDRAHLLGPSLEVALVALLICPLSLASGRVAGLRYTSVVSTV